MPLRPRLTVLAIVLATSAALAVVPPAASAAGPASGGGSTPGARAGRPAFEPSAPFDDSSWVQGTTGTATALVCAPSCAPAAVATARLTYQGTPSRPRLAPRVGERFYLHLATALVLPDLLSDRYRMRLSLPAGLEPSVRSDSDVLCAVTDTSGGFAREMAAEECVDPVVTGRVAEFAAVALDQGEVAHFFLPVVATTALRAATVALLSDALDNPLAALPDPLVSEVGVWVVPAPATAPRNLRAAYAEAARTTVSWRQPASTGGAPVLRYEARVRRVGVPRWAAWVSTKLVRSRTFTRLGPGVTYDVQVRAVNRAGAGAVASLRVRPTR